ncbi:DUF899 domain-containing protein [Limobrevibacterium gyesilva]|nr:DUF899 domain-containing protein [Limobrevibacterium gyesilva]
MDKDTASTLAAYRRELAELHTKIRAVQAAAGPEEVQDYGFATGDGPVRLSALFGARDDLIVIHNMGVGCAYCTLWADGFNGVYHHLASRAAFVVSSPDAPAVQARFAAGRGWRFPMVSHAGSSFAEDMGYRAENGGWLPGVSVFRREQGRIVRVSNARFSPGDDFCILWHVFDLLPGGAAGWKPQLNQA